jgi:hypothetical protein
MKRIAMTTLVLFNGCLLGCGMPLYPKVSLSLDPASGLVRYASEMETDVVVGPIEAGVSTHGTKTLKIGTTTQPAFAYGAKGVGVMTVYALQQEQYGKILDIVGKNTTEQINALGSWIPGIASMLSGAGVPKAQVDSALAPANDLLNNLKMAKALLDAQQGAK